MLIISQNARNYGIPLPDDTILRINLAWVNSLSELKELLEKNHEYSIFLDLPVGRIKPPNNKYTLDKLIPLVSNYKNIKYFAVSNIEQKSDLDVYVKIIPKDIIIIPKIESPQGITNIEEITASIPSSDKLIMLDHDDLYSNILKQHKDPSTFSDYINKLKIFCDKNNIILLRTIGVIFSDEEKRITEYIG